MTKGDGIGGEGATLSATPVGTRYGPDLPNDERRYELGDEIARGSGGRVVTAIDRKLGREVAIKLALDGVGSSARLVREAELLAQLEHPSIVSVHDLAQTREGTPFYVMRFLAGDTLQRRIAASKTFDDRIALLPTIIAIVDAVGYAHHRGIIHRDLKPANAIVGEFGETSVIDWGLARSISAGSTERSIDQPIPGDLEVTADGEVVGTPAFMAPEQAAGDTADARSDVYGLGAVLYHLLCGATPYVGTSAAQVIARVLDGPPLPIDEVEPRVPEELAAIVGKAMARDPAERYPSAQELGADLRRYQSGRLVAAHRYSMAAKLRLWARRHRRALAGAVAVTATAVVVIWMWPAREASATEVCGRNRDRVAAAWNPSRDAVTAHLRAAGPSGDAVALTIIARLDGYTTALGDARADACEATTVRGEQSADLLDRRMSCFDRHQDAVRATISLFDHVAASDLDGLVRAVDGLPAVGACADAAELRETTPLPADPLARTKILASFGLTATSEAQRLAGRYEPALDTAQHVLDDPTTQQFAPLAASAGLVAGAALVTLDRRREAVEVLFTAMLAAERGRADRTRGSILIQLANAYDPEQLDLEDRAALDAGAIAARFDDVQLEVDHLTSRARAARSRGDLVTAVKLRQQALVRWDATKREDSHAAALVGSVGGALMEAHAFHKAEPYLRRSVALFEKLLGADHPNTAKALGNLASLLNQTNRDAESKALIDRALAAFGKAGLADSENALYLHSIAALDDMNLRHYAEATAQLVDLVGRVRARLGESNRLVGLILYDLGIVGLRASKPADAIPWIRQSVAWQERYRGPDHIDTANARWSFAQVLLDMHEPAEALSLAVAALPVQLAQRGEASDDVAYTRWSIARAYNDLHRYADAIPYAEKIQPFFEHSVHVDERGMARMLLASALFGAGRDRPRVLELARAARADLVASKVGDDEIPNVDKLLARAQQK